MFLSKHKNGVYYIYFIDPISNKRKSISTKCRIKKDALSFLSSFKRELELKNETKVIEITLKKFFLKFLKYSESVHSPNTTKTFKTTINKFQNYFGNVLLTSIKKSDVSEYLDNRIREASNYQARKDLINLSSAFRKAVSENFLLSNPCEGIKRIKIPEKQPRFFSKKDFEKLFSVIDDELLKDISIFAVNTGLRQMEMLSLHWGQINFSQNILILDNRNHLTKSKRIRTIPLNERAMEIIIKRYGQKTSDRIFDNTKWIKYPEQLSKIFKKFILKAKLNPQLNFHSLRHTFASWLVQRGVSIYHISKLLGHADIKTTEIYSHFRTDDLSQAVKVLDKKK